MPVHAWLVQFLALPTNPGRRHLLRVIFRNRSGRVFCKLRFFSEASQYQEKEIEENRNRMFACMNRPGGIHPKEVVRQIQLVVNRFGVPFLCTRQASELCRSRGRRIKGLLEKMTASDMHSLFECNEARSMALCAEMFFRSAKLRKESRGLVPQGRLS